MSNKSDRNVMIDYLRVFAMLAVFLCHMPKKNLVPDQIVPVLPLSLVIIIFVVFIMDRTDKLFKLHFSSK